MAFTDCVGTAAEATFGAAMLGELLRHSPIGLVRTDAAWRVTEANAAFCAMLGGALPSPLGTDFPALTTEPERVRAALGTLRQGSPGLVTEWRIRRADGSALAARFTLAWHGAPGDGDGALALVEDLTPRDADRLRLRDALRLTEVTERSARLGGWEMDTDRRSLTWTRGMRALHEVPEGFSPSPLEALAFIVPESREAVNAAFLDCARSGVVLDIEAEMMTAAGRRRRIRISGEAQRDAAGRIRSVAGAFQDITEEREAREAVRELSDRLASMLDSIADAFVTFDEGLCITHANAHAAALLGRPEAELLRLPADHLPAFAAGTVFHERFTHVLRRRETVTFEAPLPGSTRWLEVRAYPAASGLTAVLHDVTDRRREQERLRLLEACVARVNDILLITEAAPIDDPGPRIVFVNEAFRRITGYGPEEVLGLTPRLLQGPRTQRAELDRIRAALERKAPVRAELINYTKDGKEIWLELDLVPVRDEAGLPTHIVAIQRDVTDRKRAQLQIERQAALLDQVGDAIVVRDMAERVIYWNRAAERIYGWTAQEVVGRGVRDLVYDDPAAIDEPMRALLAEGAWSGRFAQHRKDGSPLVVDARWQLMRNEDGSPAAVLAVSTDVTERLALEERLRRSQRLEAVGQLTGGIAHDFNNLLTVMLGNSELLADSLGHDAELRQLAELTIGAAERAAGLTARLLAFSRQQPLDPKVIDAGTLLRSLLPLLRRAAGERIALALDVEADLWPALIDPPQLEAAVLNLCINARDAMPEGGTISLRAANVRLGREELGPDTEVAPGDFVSVAVSDTGTGMTPEIAARVFEPFFTTKEVGQGSGLGLSMVYGFIKQSGGHIRLDTAPGQGTSVRLYLPRATRPGAEAEGRAAPPARPVRLLLVEDQAIVREHMEAQLRDLGHEVVAVPDAAAALAALRANPEIGLLLTDLVLPGGASGRELAAAARRLRPGLPVLLASGHGEVAAAGDGLPVLAKPYRRRDLAEMVTRALGRPG
jgi:PAS domain S-box-containing protein